MRQQGLAGLAALALAAGLLLIGAPGSAQPERRRAIEPGRAIQLPQRANPRIMPRADIPAAHPRYRLAPRAASPRARLRRFRRRYAAPYGYSYYYPPPAYYYYPPPVTYYYAPSSGYYNYTSLHRRRGHRRYRMRVAGYRAHYAARSSARARHGRKRVRSRRSVSRGHR